LCFPVTYFDYFVFVDSENQFTNDFTININYPNVFCVDFSFFLLYYDSVLKIWFTGLYKVIPLHAMEAHGGEEVSYSFLTSALNGGEWSAPRPGRALPRGKEPPVSIVQEAGWAPEPVWTQRLEEKSSVGDRTPVIQSVVRHYTD
jgi:hypothetical protein